MAAGGVLVLPLTCLARVAAFVDCTIGVVHCIARVDAEIRLWKQRAQADADGISVISGLRIDGHEAALTTLSGILEAVTHNSRQIGFDADALDTGAVS